MAHDRLDGNELPLTHEFIALMLNVRRAGVTVAVQGLSRKRLVKAGRGRIVVADRAGLEAAANGSVRNPGSRIRTPDGLADETLDRARRLGFRSTPLPFCTKPYNHSSSSAFRPSVPATERPQRHGNERVRAPAQ